MLRDPKHVFRRMWARDGWAKQTKDNACWLWRRVAPLQRQPKEQFFREALAGTHCGSNWFEGNDGVLGLQGRAPTFTANAPALFGSDDDIDAMCSRIMKAKGMWPSKGLSHAGVCVAADLNILNLFSPRVPYNICRNG